jgi:hypothetical protein
MVEVAVQVCIPRFVEGCELTVFDERPNIEIPSETPEFLVVVSLVAGQDRDGLCVPLLGERIAAADDGWGPGIEGDAAITATALERDEPVLVGDSHFGTFPDVTHESYR